jgi:hypothetical protein
LPPPLLSLEIVNEKSMRFRTTGSHFLAAAILLLGCAAPSHAAQEALITNGPLDLQDLQLVGTAAANPDSVSLTRKPEQFSAGALFLKQRLTTRAFQAAFTFKVIPSAAGVDSSGDGFTFAIAESPAAIGGNGPGLGYSGISAGGFAVEFDTWDNGDGFNDPDDNHLGIDLNGSVTSLRSAPLKIEIADGLSHTAIVSYEDTVEGGHVTVSVDGNLFLNVTDPQIGVPDGYFGFTASTGLAVAEHRIESFRLLTLAPPTTANGGIKADALLGATVGPKATLKSNLQANKNAVLHGQLTVTLKGRHSTRLRILPDSLVVNPDGSATVYGRTRSGFLEQLVRLDVKDLRSLDPVRLLRDDGALGIRWQLVKRKLKVSVPKAVGH